MTAVTLHTPTDLVAVAWVKTIPGIVVDGVATQLPADETQWAANGFIVVPTAIGGTPHPNMPIRRPVCQVECWATMPGSDKLPWGLASNLAMTVIAATYDRTTFGRALNIDAGGVTYPTARVLAATALTEPRRIWSDVGDYAGFTFDLSLTWVAAGEGVT